MTSYSIFRAELDDAEEIREARVRTFLHGAARAVLDLATVVETGRQAEAECWHSPRSGWELEAIRPDDRERFVKRVEAFAETYYDDLVQVCADIAREGCPQYVRDFGGEWYRAGYLYSYDCNGEGIGLWEYGPAGKRLSDVIGLDPINAFAFPPEHPDAAHVELYEV